MRRFALEDVEVKDLLWSEKMALNAEFLDAMDPERVLAGFRRTAGIPTDAEPYGGWENGLIAGHGVGHYFSALAMRIADLRGKDPSGKALDLSIRNAETIMSGLSECQEKYGSGFLSAATIQDPENLEIQFDVLEGKAEAQQWVPWYALHKVLQGMIDLYVYAKTAGAFSVAKALADWTCDRVLSWDEETRKRVLSVEYGGMNDSLYQLFDLTGDEKYRRAAKAFDEPELYADLLGFKNRMKGVHANATIPKILGYLAGTGTSICLPEDQGITSFDDASDPEVKERIAVSEKFWETVIRNQTYATGGLGDMEHFFADGMLDSSRSQCNAESCCCYNMIKLSQDLFEKTGKIRYLEYIEKTLWNAKLGSVGPKGGYTYFNPMATGYYRLYSPNTPAENPFWCCVSTGLEDFAKVGDQVAYKDEKKIFIAQWISSEIRISEAETISLSVDYEKGKLSIRKICAVSEVVPGDANISVTLRIPRWIKNRSKILPDEQDYLDVTVGPDAAYELDFEMVLDSFVLPDSLLPVDKNYCISGTVPPAKAPAVGFSYGPFVLCVPLGNEKWQEVLCAGIEVVAPAWKVVFDSAVMGDITYGKTQKCILEDEYLTLSEGTTVDVFRENLNEYISQKEDGSFCLSGLKNCKGENVDLPLIPYYRTGDERYGIYWYLKSK